MRTIRFPTIIGQIFLVFLVFLPVICLQALAEPYVRGFNCDDESIKYPFKESTISSGVLYGVGYTLPILMIFLVESYRLFIYEMYLAGKSEAISLVEICGQKIHPYICRVYVFVGYFLFGAGMVITLTDIGKYMIGRLRPHFLDVCRPNYDLNQCLAYEYITNYTCTGKPARVQDARESFPSGHSSFSFYTMMFTILYMQARMNFLLLDTQLLRPLIQILLFCMAFACGLSRISDYKHHWSDVLAGGILGCLVAYALAIHVSKIHTRHYSFTVESDQIESQQSTSQCPTTSSTASSCRSTTVSTAKIIRSNNGYEHQIVKEDPQTRL